MKTYAAIKAEITRLEKQAEEVRRAEIDGVIGRIKQAIAAYGLTAEDLGFGRAVRSRGKSMKTAVSTARLTTGVARYRDPATGKTWTGRGRPPDWIVAASDRDAFLIESTSDSPTEGRSRATRKSRTAAKRQARPKRGPAAKKARAGRKTSPAAGKTPAVQVESGAA